jgi:hypothetical protein
MSYINKVFNTPFFQNRFVLYGSLFLVLLSILRNIANNNINAVVLMALIGLLMSYFSKNMIIVLLTAFATVFVLEMVGLQGVMEGMETKKNENSKDEEDTSENADKEKDKDNDNDNDNDKKKDDTKSNKSEEKKTDKSKEGNQTQNNLNSQKDPAKKKKQGMASLSPASYDGKEDEGGDGVHDTKESNRIDYASTLEEAYDNIENIIGEEGVRGLTDQTKSLMHQQKELMNNMKEMGPLLKSAEGFMHQITGNGGISGITNMLKGFATPGGKK